MRDKERGLRKGETQPLTQKQAGQIFTEKYLHPVVCEFLFLETHDASECFPQKEQTTCH